MLLQLINMLGDPLGPHQSGLLISSLSVGPGDYSNLMIFMSLFSETIALFVAPASISRCKHSRSVRPWVATYFCATFNLLLFMFCLFLTDRLAEMRGPGQQEPISGWFWKGLSSHVHVESGFVPIQCVLSTSGIKTFLPPSLLKALTEYKAELRDDPIISTHLTKLYDSLLEQNLIRVIEPFSRVQVTSHTSGNHFHIPSCFAFDA